MEGFKKGAQPGAGVVSHGESMGFAHGGQVKQNPGSPQFRQTTKGMDSMDDGVQPARKGRNQQEVEAGGTKRMTPGYKEGGYVKCSHGGRAAYKKGGKYYLMKGGKMHPYMKGGVHDTYRMDDPGGGKTAMKKRGKGVVKKAHGGLAGQTASNQRRNTVDSMPSKSEGEHVQPAQRGAKHVGKGGKTGQHKGYRYSK